MAEMKVRAIIPLALIVSACGGPAIRTKTAAFALPPGHSKGASDDGVVEIGIPSGWRQGVDRMMESPLLGQGNEMGASAPADPEASKAVEQISSALTQMSNEGEQEALERLKKKGNILNVISIGNKPIIGEARTRFYVQKATQGGNWSWDEAHQYESGQYFHKPTAKEVDLPVGKAHRMEETKTLIDGGVKTTISYVIPNGKDLYCLRFVTQENAETIKSIEKQVAESIRIKP